ncbi:MAG: hypothetical protein ACO1PM_18615 [Acidovorax sp.]
MAVLALAVPTLGGALWWLAHQPHTPSGAIAEAQAFVRDVEQGRFAAAHARTARNAATGTTLEQFQAHAAHQLCPPAQVGDTLPFQSHGNRLRRWLAGREVDEPQVTVEFQGSPCLFGITLRQAEPGQWRIVRFASHAG